MKKILLIAFVITWSDTVFSQCAPSRDNNYMGAWNYDWGKIWSCPQINVGIGTEFPITELDVLGGIRGKRLTIGGTLGTTISSSTVMKLKGTSHSSTPLILDVQNSSSESLLRIYNDKQIIAGHFTSSQDAVLSLGDANHYIKSMWGKGVSIGTFQAADAIYIQQSSGKVGIGVGVNHNFGDGLLEVNGTIRSKKVVVELSGWPDYVFSENYRLRPIQELEIFINEHHHLPGLPSAKSIETDGGDLGELVRLQMEKIEELTLYVIDLEDRLGKIEQRKK